jgi:hypothetical protein
VDFNDDGTISMADFSLLSSNWALSGPRVCPGGGPGALPRGEGESSVAAAIPLNVGSVGLKLAPPQSAGKPGDIVALDVLVQAGAQPINNVELYLSFDPQALRVVDGAGNPASQIEADLTTLTGGALMNTADNATGQIRYDAMQALGQPSPSGDFRVATIRFKLLKPTPGVTVKFGPDSDAFYDGFAVTGTRDGATIVSGTSFFLPMVLK